MSAYSGNIVVALVLVVVIVVVVTAPVPVHLFVAFCLASCCLQCPPVAARWQGLTIAYNSEPTVPDPLPFPAPCTLRIKEFTREPCVDFNHLLHECQAHNELFGCSKSTANSRPLPTHTPTLAHTASHTLNSLKSKCVCYLLLCLPSG